MDGIVVKSGTGELILFRPLPAGIEIGRALEPFGFRRQTVIDDALDDLLRRPVEAGDHQHLILAHR